MGMGLYTGVMALNAIASESLKAEAARSSPRG